MNQTTNLATLPADHDGDGLPDIQDETDLDQLLSGITARTDALLADPSRRYTDLTEWQAIMELTRYANTWFDEEGNRLPVQPDPLPDVVNLSPESVHLADGEEPTFYDGLAGLHVSHQRSNGCVIIANPYLTGIYWRDNAEEVAQDEGCSARIVAMAGHSLIEESRWCGLPLLPLMGVGQSFDPTDIFYISDGGTPFNEDELRLCIYNHSAAVMHGSILAGAGIAKAPFYLNPAERRGEENEDPLPGHSMYTAGQLPREIIPRLLIKYNTPAFMRAAYKRMLYKAHSIDDGRGAPVPGYITPEEAGGEHSQAWRDKHEDSDVLNLPRFSRRGLLR